MKYMEWNSPIPKIPVINARIAARIKYITLSQRVSRSWLGLIESGKFDLVANILIDWMDRLMESIGYLNFHTIR